MVRLSDIRRDLKAERDGTWVTVAPAMNGDPAWEVRIARATPAKLRRVHDAIDEDRERADRVENGEGDLADEEWYASRVGPVVAETIVRGWRGLMDDDGQEITYDEVRAAEIFSDPGMRDVLVRIMAASLDADNYRASRLREAGKG